MRIEALLNCLENGANRYLTHINQGLNLISDKSEATKLNAFVQEKRAAFQQIKDRPEETTYNPKQIYQEILSVLFNTTKEVNGSLFRKTLRDFIIKEFIQQAQNESAMTVNIKTLFGETPVNFLDSYQKTNDLLVTKREKLSMALNHFAYALLESTKQDYQLQPQN